MKIIQIVPRLQLGGVERGILDLCNYFSRRNVRNIVVSGGGRLVKNLEKLGVTHYTLPVYKKSLATILLIPQLRKIIDKENADIIHARSRVPGWLAFFASRGRPVNYITTIHGIYKSKRSSAVMAWAKFVICPSRAVARHMKEKFDVPEEKIVVINRWVNLETFRLSDPQLRKKSNTIVAIGRISPSKGYEYLIEGFKKIVRMNPYMKLKIVGAADKSKTEYFDHLRTLVNRFSLSHNVEFPGVCQDVENVLVQARIAVTPSVIDEAFPRAVLEACACGIPVIATQVGGVTEIIENEKEGLLVEPRNSEAIANALLKLLNDNNLADNLAQRARNKIEKLYSLEKCLDETEAVYRKAISFNRILVAKISSLGDLILAIPSLKAIKEGFKNSEVILLTLKKYAPLMQDCPYLDGIITVDEDYKKMKNIFALAAKLRLRAFDYIIDLQNSRASHLLSFLSFPRYSFGYSLRWGLLLTKHLKFNRKLTPLDSQEKILELLGIRLKEKKLIYWEIKDDCKDKFIANEKNLIGINISASKRWQTKNWPISNICDLINLIYKNLPAYKVVLLGDDAAGARAQEIMRATSNRPHNLCGKVGLVDLAAVLTKFRVFVTPDTATLHLAQALGVEVVGLFGPTNPERHTIKAQNLHILCKELLCSFCYRTKCKLSKQNICLSKISANEVFAKIKEIISA
jgi:ADP-heptose:LPS heptosyltransferase/glycosyltransferase involved in cell wall biosynthesis